MLVVEVVFVEELVAAVLKTSFAPVLCPEGSAFYGLLGCQSCLGDLLKALPTGGGEGGGEVGDAKCPGLDGCGSETNAEALQTTPSAFGLVLETLDLLKPLFMVVVTIYPRDVETVGMAFTFILADVVFLARVDVGVEVENCGTNVMCQ